MKNYWRELKGPRNCLLGCLVLLLGWAALGTVVTFIAKRIDKAAANKPGVRVQLELLNRPGADRRKVFDELNGAVRRSRSVDEHFAAAAEFARLLSDPELRADAANSLVQLRALRDSLGANWYDSLFSRLRQDSTVSAALEAGSHSDDLSVRRMIRDFLQKRPRNDLQIFVREADSSNQDVFFAFNPPPELLKEEERWKEEASKVVARHLREGLESAGYRIAAHPEEADVLMEYTRIELNLTAKQPEGRYSVLYWDPHLHRLLDVAPEIQLSGGVPRKETAWLDKDEGGVYVEGAFVKDTKVNRPGVRFQYLGMPNVLKETLDAVTGAAGCDVVRSPAQARAVVRFDWAQSSIGKYVGSLGGEAFHYRLGVTVFGADGTGEPLYTKELSTRDPETITRYSQLGQGRSELFAAFRDQRVAEDLGAAVRRAELDIAK